MPRKTALEALERFRRDGAWSRQVLSSLAAKNGLDPRDTALAAMLFYGTLQNLALCDAVIAQTARGKPEPKVRDILRLGVYQILFADRIPDRAAVDRSVGLCRELGYARAAGFVNAVLRRVSAEKDRLPALPERGTSEYLTVRYSHPAWIVEELIALRGYDGAEAVLRANNETPPLFLQVNTLRAEASRLAEKLGARLLPEVPGCLILNERTDVASLQGFREGLFYVQDPAARMAVTMAGVRPGMKVLDACAAPGGKSFAAAIDMRDTGSVLAADISGPKIRLVEEGARRLGLRAITCEEADARDWAVRGETFDIVFADVPCSGLGVIRKKPDIRYREKRWLDTLPELQLELLEACAGAVKPGGALVYSTCTWREKENEGVAGAFLRNRTDFRKTEERTFWPDTDGTDGFYICRMERNEQI